MSDYRTELNERERAIVRLGGWVPTPGQRAWSTSLRRWVHVLALDVDGKGWCLARNQKMDGTWESLCVMPCWLRAREEADDPTDMPGEVVHVPPR